MIEGAVGDGVGDGEGVEREGVGLARGKRDAAGEVGK